MIRRVWSWWSRLPWVLMLAVYVSVHFVSSVVQDGVAQWRDKHSPQGLTGTELVALIRDPDQHASSFKEFVVTRASQRAVLKRWGWGSQDRKAPLTELSRWSSDPQAWRVSMTNYSWSRLRPLVASRRRLARGKMSYGLPWEVYELTGGPLEGTYLDVLPGTLEDWRPPPYLFFTTAKFARIDARLDAALQQVPPLNDEQTRARITAMFRESHLRNHPIYGVVFKRQDFCTVEGVTCD